MPAVKAFLRHALPLVVFTTSASALAFEPELGSIHQEELAQHENEPKPSRVMPPLEALDGGLGPKRVVYGYLPYWTNNLATIRWSALTHIAWFSLGISQAGDITIKHDWPDKEAVTVAHQAGVRVDLTFTLFDANAIAALVNSPTARKKAVTNMVNEMEAGDADGISIDFEFVPGKARAGFVSFVSELRAELDKRGHKDGGISIAGPTTDWAGGLDMPALMAKADYYFFMGYGYFWSGSTYAGPTGMMRVSKDWEGKTSQSATRTIAEFSTLLPAADRRKYIWGVPYYGQEWTTVSGALGAKVIGNVGSVTYARAQKDLANNVATFWDDGTKTPWYRWQESGTWHQVYFDDAKSLKAKYDLALAQDLGGVGMWALNYDAPHQELWDVLEQTFAEEPSVTSGHRLAPVVVDHFPFEDAQTTENGPSHYFNFYDCAPDKAEYGREWVYQVDLCQPGTLTAQIPSYSDHDPDVHILSALDQESCLARGDTKATALLTPGRYYVVVDTYVSKGVEREGAFDLTVDFAPKAGTTACTGDLTCDAGACVCPVATEVDCAGSCVDTASDTQNCGACGKTCSAGQSCDAGVCTGSSQGPGKGPQSPDVTPEAAKSPNDVGCGCSIPGTPRGAEFAEILALGLGVATFARRRHAKPSMRKTG